MREITCDKCGEKLLEHEVYIKKICYFLDTPYPQFKDFDLCKNCAHDLDNKLLETQVQFINKGD